MRKKVLFLIFCDNKGPVVQIQIPVTKGETVTGSIIETLYFVNLRNNINETGLNHLRLLHDNAPV